MYRHDFLVNLINRPTQDYHLSDLVYPPSWMTPERLLADSETQPSVTFVAIWGLDSRTGSLFDLPLSHSELLRT